MHPSIKSNRLNDLHEYATLELICMENELDY